MKAVTYAEYGDPRVLTLSDVPDPKVGPGEISLRPRTSPTPCGQLRQDAKEAHTLVWASLLSSDPDRARTGDLRRDRAAR